MVSTRVASRPSLVVCLRCLCVDPSNSSGFQEDMERVRSFRRHREDKKISDVSLCCHCSPFEALMFPIQLSVKSCILVVFTYVQALWFDMYIYILYAQVCVCVCVHSYCTQYYVCTLYNYVQLYIHCIPKAVSRSS